jgi:glycosyltransferase involved in cell wall biosynthesis
MPGLISCVVPVWNGVRFLAEAIDSVRSQEYRPLEIIVVDDGSTDGSDAVAAGFGAAVRLLRRPHGGLAAARNAGIAAAEGDHVAFLDVDDLWHPPMLAKQMAALAADPGRAYCAVLCRNVLAEGSAAERLAFAQTDLGRPRPGNIVSSMLLRRSVFDAVGKFDETLPGRADLDWRIRLSETGLRGTIVSEVLFDRRVHDRNLGRLKEGAERTAFADVVLKTLERRRKEGRDPRADERWRAPAGRTSRG